MTKNSGPKAEKPGDAPQEKKTEPIKDTPSALEQPAPGAPQASVVKTAPKARTAPTLESKPDEKAAPAPKVLDFSAAKTRIQQRKETAKPPVTAPCTPTEPHPEPTPRKIRKSGTGCLHQINDSLWEGSFYPRLPNGKRKKFNVYAETKAQCEIKLAEIIEQVKAEIDAEKERLKAPATV